MGSCKEIFEFLCEEECSKGASYRRLLEMIYSQNYDQTNEPLIEKTIREVERLEGSYVPNDLKIEYENYKKLGNIETSTTDVLGNIETSNSDTRWRGNSFQ